MLHFTTNATVKLPADVAIFSGLTPITGAAASLTCGVLCLETGKWLDFSDGTFKVTPTTGTMAVTALAGQTYDYLALLAPGNYPRGHYRAIFTYTITGEQFGQDFSVGMHVNRSLGYTAAYDGTTLTVSIWVEENGEVQTDYTSLTQAKLLDSSGAVITGGVLADNTSPTNGVFKYTVVVGLNPSSVYLFTCTANVPGPAGTLSFPLRFGMSRP